MIPTMRDVQDGHYDGWVDTVVDDPDDGDWPWVDGDYGPWDDDDNNIRDTGCITSWCECGRT